jgi:hypothetical protein
VRHALILAVCFLVATLTIPDNAWAQGTPAARAGAVTITHQSETIAFPAGIDFTLAGNSDFTVTRIELFCRVAAQQTEHLALVPMPVPGKSIRLTYRLDLQANFMPAGIDLSCFWRFHGERQQQADSARWTVRWYDNRYDWSSIQTQDATIHYHGISSAFAQNIATSTQTSIDSLQTLYGLAKVAPIQVWIYPNTTDFAGARQQNSREAVAGLSYPEFALTTAIIPDGNAQELGRVMPHEVSHQILYQATHNPWNAPPVWLDEGLAEYAQTAGTDGFLQSVQTAAQSGQLLGLAGLTLSFPFAPDTAYLAYAESFSAVSYIAQTYGEAGLTRLVRELATGVPYDTAFQRALGRTMEELEANWRAWIAKEAIAAGDGGVSQGGASGRIRTARVVD